MRRSDREITLREEIISVIERCDVCRVALNNDGFPYILPLNYGMDDADGHLSMFFHGAVVGRKYEVILRNIA